MAWVRWPLLIVSIWGLVWMFGLLAGLIVYPHLLESDGLRVRNGHTIEVVIPIDNINEVRAHTRSLMESRTVQLDPEDNQHLIIAMSSQVNMHVHLIDTQTAQLPGGNYRFSKLSFWADDTGPALLRLRELINGPR
ncbi:MAG: hypothetical protein Q7K25_04525 [Actinomycetota bacterium]|nr:hypothetical protein [Actinomycetota bacterium]